jgi:hypothetical protein
MLAEQGSYQRSSVTDVLLRGIFASFHLGQQAVSEEHRSIWVAR